jgi:hypothetical protein
MMNESLPTKLTEISDERISELLARSNRALGDGGNAILPRPVLLQDTMPVKGGAFLRLSDVVAKSDLNGVSPVGLNQRPGELIIDEKDITLVAIRGDDTATDGEVVVPNDT